MTNDQSPAQLRLTHRPRRFPIGNWKLNFEIFSGFGIWTLGFLSILLLTTSCDKSTPPATQPATKTIASLVPAATDLLIGMGARDRLLAVSTYDRQRPDVAGLPRVGDYQNVDW